MPDDEQPLLMVDPVEDRIFAVSPRAFAAARSRKPRLLAQNCTALFLDARGAVFRIEDVIFAQTGPIAWARLWAGRAVPARFRFAPVEITLEDFRTMVLDAMTFFRRSAGTEPAGWWLYTAPEDEVRAELGRAASLADLHARVRLPAAADCLEVL